MQIAFTSTNNALFNNLKLHIANFKLKIKNLKNYERKSLVNLAHLSRNFVEYLFLSLIL